MDFTWCSLPDVLFASARVLPRNCLSRPNKMELHWSTCLVDTKERQFKEKAFGCVSAQNSSNTRNVLGMCWGGGGYSRGFTATAACAVVPQTAIKVVASSLNSHLWNCECFRHAIGWGVGPSLSRSELHWNPGPCASSEIYSWEKRIFARPQFTSLWISIKSKDVAK
jgi:hypothetical protein